MAKSILVGLTGCNRGLFSFLNLSNNFSSSIKRSYALAVLGYPLSVVPHLLDLLYTGFSAYSASFPPRCMQNSLPDHHQVNSCTLLNCGLVSRNPRWYLKLSETACSFCMCQTHISVKPYHLTVPFIPKVCIY